VQSLKASRVNVGVNHTANDSLKYERNLSQAQAEVQYLNLRNVHLQKSPQPAADPLADAEAALKKLRQKPDDKQAAETLEQALGGSASARSWYLRSRSKLELAAGHGRGPASGATPTCRGGMLVAPAMCGRSRAGRPRQRGVGNAGRSGQTTRGASDRAFRSARARRRRASPRSRLASAMRSSAHKRASTAPLTASSALKGRLVAMS
jgi:hypothetical protein